MIYEDVQEVFPTLRLIVIEVLERNKSFLNRHLTPFADIQLSISYLVK